MTTATFICPICRRNKEIDAPVTVDRIPSCCGVESNRIWPRINISTGEFYAGWNPGLGMYIKNKQHFELMCKTHGKVPIESNSTVQVQPKEPSMIDESILKTIIEQNPDIKISGNEAEALISGVSLTVDTPSDKSSGNQP
jgi:hypothetical protein